MISLRKAFLYVLVIAIYYKLPPIPEVIVSTYYLEVLSFIDQRLYFLIFPLVAIFLLKNNFKEFKNFFVLKQKNRMAQITLASFTGYVFFFVAFFMIAHAISVSVNFTIPFYEKKPYSYLDIIYLIIISSVFEEFFFRRILAYQFFKRYGFNKAVFYSAFLFMIIHNVYSWPKVFIIGYLLGYIYLKTRNIYITIGLHALQNFNFIMSTKSVSPLILFLENYKHLKYFWYYYIISFFIVIIVLYYSFRYLNRYYKKYNAL